MKKWGYKKKKNSVIQCFEFIEVDLEKTFLLDAHSVFHWVCDSIKETLVVVVGILMRFCTDGSDTSDK